MRKLSVFNNVTLDGYFTGVNGDLSWAYQNAQDAEWNTFVGNNASSGGQLLLGRITYEMMVSYWPTPLALEQNPVVAAGMNSMPKVVFSNTLAQASLWNNTTVVNGDIVAEVRSLKQQSGPGMTILGSGSIVAQLAQAGLIDEYQVVVNPVVLGAGRTMFEGIKEKLSLKLTTSRSFSNGNTFLRYEPLRP